MTGWRLGYSLGPTEWIKAMLKVGGHCTSNPNSIAQWAAVEAFNGPQESVGEMLGEYTRQARLVAGSTQGIPRISCGEPEGAFTHFRDVRGCSEKS